MPSQPLTESLSPQERYAREVARVLAQVGRLEVQAVRRTLALLTAARRRILAVLAEVPEGAYLANYLPALRREIETAMARYRTQYAALLNGEGAGFWDLGVSLVDAPIGAMGLAGVVTSLPALDPTTLDVLQGVRASLIQGISAEAIRHITVEVQLGVLSGATPFQVQRAVAEILRTQPNAAGRFGTIARRAEAVTRTELNRTLNLAAQARQTMLAARLGDVFPDLRPHKVWMTARDDRVRPSHRRMDGQTVPVDDTFTLVGANGVTYRVMGPHDARLPAGESTNCRCVSRLSVESLLPALENV